jgi:hypothetical protein
MRAWRQPASLPRWVISSYQISILAIGSAGCANFNLNQLFTPPPANPIGFLINTDSKSDVLGGIRLADGRSVYAYGTFKPDGNVNEITAAVIREADGKESSILFDGGLISEANGADGSTLKVAYDERTETRLRGHVDIFFAPINETHTINFDADLLQAAADLAQQVEQFTGLKVSNKPPPEDPGSKLAIADALVTPAMKDAANSQFIFAFIGVFQYSFAAVGFACVQLMATLVRVMVEVLVGVVVALTRAIVIAVCTPFILLGEIMRSAVSQGTFLINFSLDIDPLVVIIPRRPRHH